MEHCSHLYGYCSYYSLVKTIACGEYVLPKFQQNFKNLHPIIPSFFTSSTTFDKTFFYFKAVGQSFSKARVLVETGLDSYLEPVFTLQPGFCGQEGDYIHLTPDYIKSFRKLPFPFQEKGETKNLQFPCIALQDEVFTFKLDIRL